MKLHRIGCYALGWIFVLIGIAAIVMSNHSTARVPLASPEWWAYISALPIGALFLIAAGLAKADAD